MAHFFQIHMMVVASELKEGYSGYTLFSGELQRCSAVMHASLPPIYRTFVHAPTGDCNRKDLDPCRGAYPPTHLHIAMLSCSIRLAGSGLYGI